MIEQWRLGDNEMHCDIGTEFAHWAEMPALPPTWSSPARFQVYVCYRDLCPARRTLDGAGHLRKWFDRHHKWAVKGMAERVDRMVPGDSELLTNNYDTHLIVVCALMSEEG